jgi:hypothetical protein
MPEQPKQDAQPIPNGMPSQTETPLKPSVKRSKGNGDTDTTGKHSTRYQFYRAAVLKGKLNPSVNAFKQVKYHGKKIGSTTAQEFLSAMINDGLLEKGKDAKGRTIYTRVQEACHV